MQLLVLECQILVDKRIIFDVLEPLRLSDSGHVLYDDGSYLRLLLFFGESWVGLDFIYPRIPIPELSIQAINNCRPGVSEYRWIKSNLLTTILQHLAHTAISTE